MSLIRLRYGVRCGVRYGVRYGVRPAEHRAAADLGRAGAPVSGEHDRNSREQVCARMSICIRECARMSICIPVCWPMHIPWCAGRVCSGHWCSSGCCLPVCACVRACANSARSRLVIRRSVFELDILGSVEPIYGARARRVGFAD